MKKPICFLCCLLLVAACKKNHPVNNSTTPTISTPGVTIQLSSFPLKAGNMWVYDNGDTIRAVADTVINGMPAVKMVKTNGSAIEISFYTSQSDGFYQLGTNSRYHALEAPAGLLTDTITFYSTPVLLAKYPNALNTRWETHDPLYAISIRIWTGYATVTTKAGRFDCIKMDIPGGSEYYATKGLIRVTEQPNCLVAPCPEMGTNLVYVNF